MVHGSKDIHLCIFNKWIIWHGYHEYRMDTSTRDKALSKSFPKQHFCENAVFFLFVFFSGTGTFQNADMLSLVLCENALLERQDGIAASFCLQNAANIEEKRKGAERNERDLTWLTGRNTNLRRCHRRDSDVVDNH